MSFIRLLNHRYNNLNDMDTFILDTDDNTIEWLSHNSYSKLCSVAQVKSEYIKPDGAVLSRLLVSGVDYTLFENFGLRLFISYFKRHDCWRLCLDCKSNDICFISVCYVNTGDYVHWIWTDSHLYSIKIPELYVEHLVGNMNERSREVNKLLSRTSFQYHVYHVSDKDVLDDAIGIDFMKDLV